MLRIGILGQPCIDEIVAPDGSVRSRSLGGVFYSYAAMERAMRTAKSPDSFLHLTWNSLPDAEILNPFYAKLTHLGNMPRWNTQSLTNRVRLIYSSDADRIEHCAIILPPLTPLELRDIDFTKLDGIFVNMISGYDISLDTFEWIREQAPRAHIHLDVHALILGDLSSEIGVGRTPRGIPEWRGWIEAADTIQMNELEARWIASPEIKSDEALIRAINDVKFKDQTNRESAVIITRAERGATAYLLKSMNSIDILPHRTSVVETTGSGDVFGAQFLYSLLTTHDYTTALREAVDAASFNTILVGVDALVNGI